MNYYHYTKGCHLAKIVNEGIIRTSKNLIEKKEKPAVWLTTSPVWEPACNIGHVVNADELVSGQTYSSDEVEIVTSNDDYMKKEIGMCRIVLSERISVISWGKFKHVSGISEPMYYALDEHSRSIGSPVNQWYCKFSGIPSKYWEGIEMYVDNQWVRWDEEMPIQEFVDLCLSCNGKQAEEEELINGFPKVHALSQVDFMARYHDEIKKVWEANKDKKGYIEIYITPDYKPYTSGFKFIEKRIRKDSFKPLYESAIDSYALVHFLWEATHTQYKIAVAL
jgi:hypothetical protein